MKLSSSMSLPRLFAALVLMLAPGLAFAAGGDMNLINSPLGITALVIFVLAYSLVIMEEKLHLQKSKPVIVAAGLIWALVAITYAGMGDISTPETILEHNLLEFVELFLFLLAAMTFINTMEERGVFDVLRVWLVTRGFTLRQIFWITGVIAFFLSPIADNLTTALLMATVVMAVGQQNHKFVAIACLNIVVAANAGGAFSPFGDITTLMVWQAEMVEFQQFFALFVPSVVNWVVTAGIISLWVSNEMPPPVKDSAELKYGAWFVVGLFILTISMAVSAHNLLHLPPVLGMMTGLGFLKLFGYYLQRRDMKLQQSGADLGDDMGEQAMGHGHGPAPGVYNIYANLQRAEWDTLMFFYGVILCVGGLGTFGYLAVGSQITYTDLGPTVANIIVGFASAIVDNIPVMFAVLEMKPEMDLFQWLLVTLTAGVGGSMLSIGSAAGVAVMGQARGIYTFFSHLKFAWAVMLGYFASIWVHFLLNAPPGA
ncbi:MAG: sodium:proton antiporter NhaD [Xanthomonadales bacterium]|nr:sodium:proton antiporter NhaD [Xanthomonadales bacterium]